MSFIFDRTRSRKRLNRFGNRKFFLCICCEDQIYNRGNNSHYCKDCAKDIDKMRNRIHHFRFMFKQTFPKYRIDFMIKISKVKNA